MKKLRDILRLSLDAKLSLRAIERVLNLSIGVIQKVVSRANAVNLTWAQVQSMDEPELNALFYPAKESEQSTRHQLPDWSEMNKELRRKGVTNAYSSHREHQMAAIVNT